MENCWLYHYSPEPRHKYWIFSRLKKRDGNHLVYRISLHTPVLCYLTYPWEVPTLGGTILGCSDLKFPSSPWEAAIFLRGGGENLGCSDLKFLSPPREVPFLCRKQGYSGWLRSEVSKFSMRTPFWCGGFQNLNWHICNLLNFRC